MAALTSPYAGIGISLGYKLSGGSTFTTIGLLKDDAEFDGFDTAVISTNVLATGVATKVPGRTDYGTFNGSVYLVNADAGVAQLLTLSASKAFATWQVTLPDESGGTGGSTYTFSGFVSNVKPGGFTGEDSPSMDFTLAISGAVTVVVAS